MAQAALDLFCFKKNADENKRLKGALSSLRLQGIHSEEIRHENARLAKLLSLRRVIPANFRRVVVSRVIARSSFAWNRSFLIDKGSREGIRANMLALSDNALVGKVVEVGPSVSKVLVISDPGFRMSVLVQRTRDQGMLYGSANGRCRIKYIPVETELKKGDLVETAGLGHFFLKAIPVGLIERSWKERGQIYQVAEMEPLAGLNRLEEISCVE
ncbi:MAG: rod shape-determining protein MreC [Omnitrophica bacterium RIFCSPHIGHO2_02_FULL_51_18]|nr:MAG: rod shape-determining protein MreC [Omnitrophica bacterium RIFCSPHIGHO2_02_FULL_51_18]